MNLLKRKAMKGGVIFKIIILLVIIVFVTIYGLQIGMGFFEKKQINEAVDQVFTELDVKTSSQSQIKSLIINKLSVATFNIPDDDIVVKKIDNSVIVNISYVKNIPITNDISIVMNLGLEKEN